MKTFSNQRGFSLVAAAIAAAIAIVLATLVFGGLNSVKSQKARSCQTSLASMQRWESLWNNSLDNGSPDMAICKQLNDLSTDYNKSCGKQFGMVPIIPCEEFETN